MKYNSRVEDIHKDSDQWKLYDLIVRYFYATLSTDAKIKQITTTFKLGNSDYTERHSVFSHEGFAKYLELSRGEKQQYNVIADSYKTAKAYVITKCKIQKWQTAPPEYLSEADLVQKMEKNRIGTDGTIHQHIRKIVYRKYVAELKGDKTVFIPTNLGVALAEGFSMVDEEMIKPKIRQDIEKTCLKVSNREISYDDAIMEVRDTFRDKLRLFMQTYQKIRNKLKELKQNKEEPIEPIVAVRTKEARRQERGGDYLMDESTVASTEDLEHQDDESSSSEK